MTDPEAETEPTVTVPAAAVRFAADELEENYDALDLRGDHADRTQAVVTTFRQALGALEPETVTVTVRRELADEMAQILRDEVWHADEIHSTEEAMAEMKDALQDALEQDQ